MVTHRGAVGVPSVSTQCLGLLRVLEPPDVVHHWGCRLASLHRGSSNPVQRLALGSSLQRSSRGRAPWEDKTCAWTRQFEFGNIWCTNKLHTTETSFAKCTILWEVSRWPTTMVKENGCGRAATCPCDFFLFFSCIAERARGIVGQLSDISSRARQLLSWREELTS